MMRTRRIGKVFTVASSTFLVRAHESIDKALKEEMELWKLGQNLISPIRRRSEKFDKMTIAHSKERFCSIIQGYQM